MFCNCMIKSSFQNVIFLWFLTTEPACKFTCEKHISQLALAVGKAAVVAALTVQVMKSNPAEIMSQWGNDHNSSRRTALYETNEKIC